MGVLRVNWAWYYWAGGGGAMRGDIGEKVVEKTRRVIHIFQCCECADKLI